MLDNLKMKQDPARRPKADHVVVLPSDADYIDQLAQVQLDAYDVPLEEADHPELLQAENFETQLRVFPEGQFMALDPETDTVVGTCTSMMIDHDISQPVTEPWRITTDYGSLRTHNPRGEWLYGVDNVVVPRWRGRGIGGRMMRARYNVARRLNLRGMIAGSMPIDYHKAAAQGVDIHTYIAQVLRGERWDTNLSKQIRKGCRVLNVIPNYLTDAEDTLNYGVAIVWDNPDYRPARTTHTRKPARPAREVRLQPGRPA
ncbi:MAG: GNAT family N-acetyltransferase [Chloroflexota bacterium]